MNAARRRKRGNLTSAAASDHCEPGAPNSRLRQCHIKDHSVEPRVKATAGSVESRRRSEIIASISRGDLAIHQAFAELIPLRPYCCDDFFRGLRIRPRVLALLCRHVQFNRPRSLDWMCFDVDRADAALSWEDADLLAPTVVCVNPENGHAHFGYLLSTPVHRFRASRRGPLNWFADIQRGYTRRLGADMSFNGVATKNPLHPDWRVRWLAAKPYALGDLDCALDRSDKAAFERPEQEIGEGRNVMIFDAVRRQLYREAFRLREDGGCVSSRACDLAAEINQTLTWQLAPREVLQIGRSIGRWIERNFSQEEFSERQRQRARRRWKDHRSVEAAKPWAQPGISRATYYRRKKKDRSGV